MAEIGGGWMSDYDTFPLHDFRQDGILLPNSGGLTVHNRLCPSLVSGSATEWLRISHEIIRLASEQQINSDQKALVVLYQLKPTSFFQDWCVTQTVVNASGWNTSDCEQHTPPSMRAVHFAHTHVKRALRERRLPTDWSMRNRAEIALQFHDSWLATCGSRKVFLRDERLLLASRPAIQPMSPFPQGNVELLNGTIQQR
jgi:hypothetical protein